MEAVGFLAILLTLFEIALGLIAWLACIRIIRRTGHSGWWALTAFIPVVNVILLWVFAFVRWPAIDGSADPTPCR